MNGVYDKQNEQNSGSADSVPHQVSAVHTPDFLDLTLAPHRSLPPTGFYIMMGLVVGVALITGILFVVVGAWPVFGFLGLDVIGLWFAFRLSYRQGLAREVIHLDDRYMIVERIAPSGDKVRVTLDPSWLKVDHDGEPELARPLLLRNPSGVVEIGSFLNQRERREIASVIRNAIDQWRQPPLSAQPLSAKPLSPKPLSAKPL